MKKIILFLFVVSFYSCKKDAGFHALREDIQGTWELEQFIGYPFDQPVLPAGNGQIIVLGANGLFERKQGDSLIFKGTYSLQTKKDCYPRHTEVSFSTTESSPGTYQYVDIANERLELSTPNCYQDGGSAYYRRVK